MMELMWHYFRFSGRVPHEASLYEPIPPGHDLFLSKKPPDTVRIEEVFVRDPELYVIAMLRDPRAVITSKHPSRPDVYFSSFRRWRQYANAIGRMMDHPRYLVVRYESLVIDAAAIQRQVEDKFPFLERTGDFAAYPEGVDPGRAGPSLGGTRRLDPAALIQWHNHLPRVKGQLIRYPNLSNALIRFGYEQNRDWEAMLEDVEPCFQQYKEAPPNALKRIETRLRYWLKRRAYLSARRRTGVVTTS
jgi:hypothetical protein